MQTSGNVLQCNFEYGMERDSSAIYRIVSRNPKDLTNELFFLRTCRVHRHLGTISVHFTCIVF